ncbi:MAG: cytoplasmic protein [Gemella sp.]|nr:cytoplasmic protein [Gemella sp.]
MKQFQTKDFTVTVFTSAENSFLVTATLIEHNQKAFLVNGKFTQSDSQEIVDYITEKDLELEKIYVIHGDPDYYFGLETIKKAFPNVVVYASIYTIDHILHTVQKKLAVWGPQLGDNAPTNVLVPKAFTEKSIKFAGQDFALVGDDEHRLSLYNKENRLLIGGIDTFNETHVFLADTATKEKIQDWRSRLNSLLALDTALVIPSHADASASFDKAALQATADYLEASLEVLDQVSDSTSFADAMKNRYPSYLNTGVLALSAKVITGEMQWG